MPQLRQAPPCSTALVYCPFLSSASASASAANHGYGETSPELASYIASEGGQTGTTLSGKITQTGNGQPLSGALVVIDELRREVRAGDDGSYRSTTCRPGQYHVGVRAEGYSTRRTEVTVGTAPTTLDISIDFDLHFAEVLSVSPTARPQFESYQPTTVLDGQELTKNLEATIGATLSEAPGRGDARVRPRLGAAGDSRPRRRSHLVLEDGQRMGDLSSQSGDHSVPTDPAAARKIEVVRGPATLLYGANAIGGLVNVITDSIPSEQTQGTSGNFTFNFGSNGGAAGGAGDIHVGNGKYALHFGGAGNAWATTTRPRARSTTRSRARRWGRSACRGPARSHMSA